MVFPGEITLKWFWFIPDYAFWVFRHGGQLHRQVPPWHCGEDHPNFETQSRGNWSVRVDANFHETLSLRVGYFRLIFLISVYQPFKTNICIFFITIFCQFIKKSFPSLRDSWIQKWSMVFVRAFKAFNKVHFKTTFDSFAPFSGLSPECRILRSRQTS